MSQQVLHDTAKSAVATRNRINLLIVADEPGLRRDLQALMTGQGFFTTALECAQFAIDTMQCRPVDILLSDIAMPGQVNGIDLARWTLFNRPETKILLMSQTMPWIAATSPLAAVPVLIKPLDQRALLERLAGMAVQFVAAGAS